MIEKYMTGKKTKQQSESRKKANADIKRICTQKKLGTTHEMNSTPNVGPELAEAIFGKVFGGNPKTGEVPGARPMTDQEFWQFAYKGLKRLVSDPENLDDLFNMEALFGESSDVDLYDILRFLPRPDDSQ